MDDLVTLTGYADQVRELVRNDRNDEAIAISKHILRYYPKYVEAYRQLGEAFLEKGQLDDAKEMFRRVLSADPENVVAYAGLAVILEQEHLIAEAAWHMERAYELAPSNTELHKELHRLYHELDGRPRARLELTPGALARLYIKEGLFPQAIQELNAIVAETAARFDARVALAETLWRVGQMRQAAEVAQTLLESLPYCLKANLILGAVWKETGLAESDQYLQRAQVLDPTNQTAQHLFGERSPVLPIQARVPRYVEGAPTTPAPVAEPSAPAETPLATHPLEAPAESIAEVTREATPFEPAFKPPVTDTTLPPWLRAPSPEIIEEQAAPAQPVEPVAETPVEPAPVSQPVEEPPHEPIAEKAGEVPAWLAQLRQAEELSAETTAEAPVEEAASAESALPPWMRAEAKTQETVPPTPSWIEEAKSAEATEAPRAAQEESQPEAPSALPPWLAEPSRAEEPAPAIPTWIEEAKSAEATESPRPSKEEPPPEAAPAVPPWVAVLSHAPEPAPASASQPSEQELPPWISQPAQPTAAAPVQGPVSAEPEIKPREEKVPPWFGQPAQPTVAAPAAEPAPTAAPVAPTETRAAPKRKPATRGDSHLILARTFRDANQMQEALKEYDYVVQKAPRLVNQVIADLQTLSKRQGVPIEAHRILGDAYTRADRLAEALEEYRFVLEHTSQRAG